MDTLTDGVKTFMEELVKDEIKKYYGKKFIASDQKLIYTINKKGSKNSYVTWIDDSGREDSFQYTNEDILKNIKDGTWKIQESEIDKYYDCTFYVCVESEVFYKIEKRDNETCNISLINSKKNSKEKGIHYNSDVVKNFKNGTWILLDNKVTDEDKLSWTRYKVPHDLFNGEVKQGDYYELYTDEFNVTYGRPVLTPTKYILPKEIVLTWVCTSNVKSKPIDLKDLKVGDWVVVLKEDSCYHNCEKERPQQVKRISTDFTSASISFSNGHTNSYTKMRKATKEELSLSTNKIVDVNIFTVINKISI